MKTSHSGVHDNFLQQCLPLPDGEFGQCSCVHIACVCDVESFYGDVGVDADVVFPNIDNVSEGLSLLDDLINSLSHHDAGGLAPSGDTFMSCLVSNILEINV